MVVTLVLAQYIDCFHPCRRRSTELLGSRILNSCMTEYQCFAFAARFRACIKACLSLPLVSLQWRGSHVYIVRAHRDTLLLLPSSSLGKLNREVGFDDRIRGLQILETHDPRGSGRCRKPTPDLRDRLRSRNHFENLEPRARNLTCAARLSLLHL